MNKVGLSLKDQKAALTAAGVDDFSEFGPVYIDHVSAKGADDRPQRAFMISALLPGDQVVVACASCLGSTAVEVMGILDEIGSRGAVVFDYEQQKLLSFSPEALDAIQFARRAESQYRTALAKKMRRARVQSGNLGGAPSKLTDEQRKEIEELWYYDHSKSGKEIADMFGITQRTLHRWYGNRKGNDNSKKGAEK